MKKTIDKQFLFAITILIIVGFFIFSSASLGLLAKSGDKYSSVAFSQTFFGLFLGTILLVVCSRIQYKLWRQYSFFLFVGAITLTLLVFVPGIGFSHGGAKRWLILAGYSIQPSEFLKAAYVIYVAAWMAGVKDKITTIKFGLLPFLFISGLVGIILLAQPDTDTFLVMLTAGLAMFLTAGGKWRHVLVLFVIAVVGLAIMASFRPYIKQRILTYLDPSSNSQTSGYQIQQSLIAIGSGGFSGRGFGQSIQKFNFLPEPIGDSIYAVAAEEFGFLGATFLVLLFVFFALRGLKIAAAVPETYGRLLVVGIVILIISQAFNNIGSMVGILPLTGIPLPFVSHGGTALLITLALMGIVLNVSRHQKQKGI
jgi:cell division protein FtsW